MLVKRDLVPIAESPAKTALKKGTQYLFPALLLLLAAGAWGEEVVTSDGKRVEAVVVRIVEAGVVVKEGAGEKTYGFDELKAPCAYEFYKRLFAKDDAKGHVKAAKFCIKRKLWAEAGAELVEARKLDPSLENEVNRIWAESGAPAPPPPDAKKVVEAQLAMGPEVEKAAGEKVSTFETEHFVIHTTFPPADRRLLEDLSEKLYRGFDRIFQIDEHKDRMWDGKCLAFLFKDREGYVKFATVVDHFPGGSSGGYFRAAGRQCEIVIPNVGGLDRFKETMVHEGTHAFLHFYRVPGRVPRWVQEGTAQYYEFEEFPKSAILTTINGIVTNGVKSGKILGIAPLEESDRPKLGTDVEGYAWCYTYVSYLIHVDPKKYAEFIRGMKAGLEPQEALKKAFGWDYAQLQKEYLKAVAHLR